MAILAEKAVFYLPFYATFLLVSWPVMGGGKPGAQAVPVVSPADANGRFHFETARALYRAGQYRKSLAELELSEQSGEKVPRRPYYVALNHEQLQEHDEVIRILSGFLKTAPKDEDSFTLLATAEFYSGNYSGAASAARSALELNPRDSNAHRLLGLADLKMERRNDAYEAWLAATRVNPSDPAPPYLIGRLFYEANNFGEAIKWLRQAVVLSAGNFRALYYWGLSCQALGRLDEAVTLYRRSMVLSQSQGAKYSWVYGSLGKLLTKMGQEDEAEKVLDAGAKEAPDAVIFAAQGDLRLREHKLPDAETSLRHAISLDPALPDSYYTLGRVLHAEGRVPEAEAMMQTFDRARLAADAKLHTVDLSKPDVE